MVMDLVVGKRWDVVVERYIGLSLMHVGLSKKRTVRRLAAAASQSLHQAEPRFVIPHNRGRWGQDKVKSGGALKRLPPYEVDIRLGTVSFVRRSPQWKKRPRSA